MHVFLMVFDGFSMCISRAQDETKPRSLLSAKARADKLAQELPDHQKPWCPSSWFQFPCHH